MTDALFLLIHWLVVHPIDSVILLVAPGSRIADFVRGHRKRRMIAHAKYERATGKRMPWYMRETVREWFE